MSDKLFRDPMFLRFCEERPVAVMAQMALRCLLDDAVLLNVFNTHAQTQREENVPFAALTRMLANVVLGQEPSVNAAILKMHAELNASHQAVYKKLQRVELSTSRGLVSDSFQRVVAMHKQFGGRRGNDVPGYETRIIDGNHLAGTEHRLKETRHDSAAPLPGKTLVVYSPRHNAIADCFPIEDGHAQERSELDAVLEIVRRKQLWIADRNFCTLKFLYGLALAGAAFIIRQHGQVHGTPVGKPRRVSKRGQTVIWEQKFQLPSFDGEVLTIRRVLVDLPEPTRDGEQQIALLTNLPKAEVNAVTIAEQYRLRWRIETVMQRLTDALRCEIRPLCYPKAALFGFALALVMYNALAIVLGALDAAHGSDSSANVSYYRLALEITQTSDGMMIALPPSRWSKLVKRPLRVLAAELTRIAAGVDLERYAKTSRGPKVAQPKRKRERRKVHVSTKKLLDQRKWQAG